MEVSALSRCAVITVDPDTGERDKEQLATLSTYRVKEGKVCFGMNAIALSEGPLVRLGDELR